MTVSFRGVLLKRLSDQADRDDLRIDPDGVRFDPETTYTWNNFQYEGK